MNAILMALLYFIISIVAECLWPQKEDYYTRLLLVSLFFGLLMAFAIPIHRNIKGE